MSDPTPFAHHAIVELMGHVRLAGFASETTIAGAGCVRVDVPDENGGTKGVKYCSPQSIYAITPCDEETARRTANPPRYTYGAVHELEAADDGDESYEAWVAEGKATTHEHDPGEGKDLDYD
jgi:hypothetical protein